MVTYGTADSLNSRRLGSGIYLMRCFVYSLSLDSPIPVSHSPSSCGSSFSVSFHAGAIAPVCQSWVGHLLPELLPQQLRLLHPLACGLRKCWVCGCSPASQFVFLLYFWPAEIFIFKKIFPHLSWLSLSWTRSRAVGKTWIVVPSWLIIFQVNAMEFYNQREDHVLLDKQTLFSRKFWIWNKWSISK